jgi:DNA-directed RNA polymerase II subunit RPB2
MASQSLSEVGLRFLEKYFAENDFALTRHHIDSYEQCVFDEIPSIIHTANPIVLLKESLDKDAGVFAYRVEIFIGGDVERSEDLGLTISPPVVALDEGNTVRRMFPNEARLRNATYAAQINADILIRVTFTKPNPDGVGFVSEVKEAPLIRGFPLMRLPILLRSRLCATAVADPFRLEEMGECRNDYGGYFIVSGAEKVLITRGEQAFNSLYVEKKPTADDKVAAYASVVSLHPETKQTRRVALYVMRGGEIRVAVPMIRGAFPLFILFRAMGLESDEEIVRMIFPVPHGGADPLQDALIPSIEDAYPIYNKYTATKYIMSLTKGFTEAHVLDILQNLMLPHVPDEPMARAQYLAEMAREALRANAGLRGKTDRDDMRNQRFLPTGTLLRELFNGCWKEWRAAVTLTIDRTYRSNEQLYQGEAVFDLFAEGNLMSVFQPTMLNQGIMRGFRGKWGTNAMNEKTGVLQPLARISYLDAMSHVRRVVSDFDTGMKTTGPRKLHTSQIGYFCTSETPTGAHIGATKNMSMMTQFSLGAPTRPVYGWLLAKGGLIPVGDTTAPLRVSAAVVQINGGTVGFTLDPRGLVRVLRLLKWNACLAPTASVSFNTTERTVRILLDEGRPIRPLWHLSRSDKGEGAAFLDRIPALLGMPWPDLVFGTHPATIGSSLRTVRFLDPLGDQPAATFADYETALASTAGFIEYCDPVEMNEAFISWWGSADELTTDHTHAEIHPSTLTGLLASMIPYSNHNQAPRNQLSCSQSKQGIGTMVTNLKDRYDTYSHQLCYGEAPLCRTFMYETIGNGEMPYGSNCIIAATSETGYNQDDGLIINRDSVARGLFQSLSFRAYDCAEEVDSRTKVHSHIANPGSVPSWTSLRPGQDYSKLDERGIIREGEIVTAQTVLVGRYMVIPDTNELKDASITPGLYTQGRVDSVVVLHQGDGKLLVKVRVIELRMPQLGDKFSSRHGQKGTIGMFVSAADLPRTAEGLVPDVMVNPGGLISRMTVAQLVEMVAGRVSVEVAAKINATTFCNGGEFVRQLGDVLELAGSSRAGDNVLYSGITGVQIRTDIFMCPLYFMRLKHLTDDKVNSRGAGKREIRTHQPTGGRANEGGLRIGEMERDSLCAHGVSTFLQESMMKRGDATEFWICNGCGRIPIYNEAESLFVCSTCDGPLTYNGLTPETLTMQLPTKQSRATFSKVAMPYSLKLLDQELSTFMNAGFRFVSEGSISRLRESDWNWPTTVDIDFKAGPALEAATEVNPEAKPQRKQNTVAATTATATEDAMAVRFSNKLQNEFSGFSNFAASPFRLTGGQEPAPDGTQYPEIGIGANGSVDAGKQTWPTVEHYYQAMKFPADPEWQEAIRRAATPVKAKTMGNDPAHPLRGDWDAIKERVMKKALKAKFEQNPALLALLQSTGDRKLVEASTSDLYWGSGPSTGSRKTGKGQNRLGVLMEEVRGELKDIRADQTMLAAAAPALALQEQEQEEEKEKEQETLSLEKITQQAQDTIAEATAGIVKLAGIPEASETKEATETPAAAAPAVQQGGVYLFINPAAGHSERRRRDRGSGRNLSWEGMSVSKEGSDDVQTGGADASEQMTTESGNTTEVKVEKLGS